jgi:hypothetical protein
VQYAAASHHKEKFLLARILDGLAGSMRIESCLTESRNAYEGSILTVTFAEHRLVMASRRGQVYLRVLQFGNKAVQPRRSDFEILRRQGGRQ